MATKRYLRQQRFGQDRRGVRAVFLGDYISRSIILDDIFEKRELEMLSREVFPFLPPPNSIALDIGANIGNHALFLAQHFDRVIAFEPNPMVACILRANVINSGEAIEIFGIGLSNTDGHVNFAVDNCNLGRSRISEDNESTGTTIQVEKLDVIAESLSLSNVSFIKIDVEGHEAKVFEGASNLLSSSHPVIAMEANFQTYPELESEVMLALQPHGYRHIYQIKRVQRKAQKETDLKRILRHSTKLIREVFRDAPPPLQLEKTENVSGRDHSLLIISVKPIGIDN